MNYSKEVQGMIDTIVEDLDNNWEPDGYIECLEDSCILECFEENYSSHTIGKHLYDDLIAKEIRKSLKNDELLLELIRANSSEEMDQDYRVQWNEMGSVTIGESEYQLDGEQYPELFTAMGRNLDCSIHVYGRPCERVILKLDPAAFLKSVAKYLKTKRTKAVVLEMNRYNYRRGKFKSKKACPWLFTSANNVVSLSDRLARIAGDRRKVG